MAAREEVSFPSDRRSRREKSKKSNRVFRVLFAAMRP
jgi:hypothetical protein